MATTRVQVSTLPTGATVGTFLRGDGTWAAAGASDGIFWENDQNVTTNYTITASKNAVSAGPVTVDSGVEVTVTAGGTLVVV